MRRNTTAPPRVTRNLGTSTPYAVYKLQLQHLPLIFEASQNRTFSLFPSLYSQLILQPVYVTLRPLSTTSTPIHLIRPCVHANNPPPTLLHTHPIPPPFISLCEYSSGIPHEPVKDNGFHQHAPPRMARHMSRLRERARQKTCGAATTSPRSKRRP